MAVGIPQRGPGLSPAWPTPSAVPHRLHHDSQWCWAGGARWLKHRNRQTDGASTNHVPWPAPAPTPCTGPWPKRGLLPPRPNLSRERAMGRGGEGPGSAGAVSPGAGADDDDQEQLIPFLVLCRFWRDFLGLGGGAGPLGGLGRHGRRGLLPGGGDCGRVRSGWG